MKWRMAVEINTRTTEATRFSLAKKPEKSPSIWIRKNSLKMTHPFTAEVLLTVPSHGIHASKRQRQMQQSICLWWKSWLLQHRMQKVQSLHACICVWLCECVCVCVCVCVLHDDSAFLFFFHVLCVCVFQLDCTIRSCLLGPKLQRQPK